jgi:hypothetical protein
MGQRQLLQNIATNHLNDIGGSKLLVYVTYSRKEATALKSQLDKNSKFSDYIIFTLSDNPSDTEYYNLPKLALLVTQRVIGQLKLTDSLDILYCFDDISTYIFKDKHLSQTSRSFVNKQYNLSQHTISSRISMSNAGSLKTSHLVQ